MSWNKVYENDENGNRTSGNFQDLLKAIRQGNEVRMLITFAELPKQEYFTPAENIWIRGGKTVYAQNISHVSVTSEADGDLRFQDDSFYWMRSSSTPRAR